MFKEIQSKSAAAFLVCSCCSRPKKLTSYILKWQQNKRVCNYCREFRPFNNIVITNVAAKDKLVNCLRCDKNFKGRNNIRICKGCKDTEAYKDDCLFSYFETGVTA